MMTTTMGGGGGGGGDSITLRVLASGTGAQYRISLHPAELT